MTAQRYGRPGPFSRPPKPGVYSMNYGLPAFLIGWFLTFFLFCLGLTVASMVAEAMAEARSGYGGGLGLYLLPITLIYGFPVAAVIGLPLALLVASPLRRVRKQWIHVVVFAGAVGAAVAAVTAVLAAGAPGAAVIGCGPWSSVLGLAPVPRRAGRASSSWSPPETRTREHAVVAQLPAQEGNYCVFRARRAAGVIQNIECLHSICFLQRLGCDARHL